MKIFIFILSVIILFVLLCCSYDEPESKDKIPPSKVHLIPHRCDPGDPGCTYTDKNNGIDPVQSGNPDDNWMRIQWGDELIKDPDIDHIDVYRYNNEDTTKVMVDRIDYHLDSTQYVDKFNGVDVVIQRTWSYYIIPYDEADNFTNSDTVSYKLIDKPGLQSPDDNYECSVTDSITFSWFGPSNYSYRILFFDLSHNLQFAKDLIPGETECNIPEILENSEFSPIPEQTYIWRIDAFDGVGGSESEERKIKFSSNR